MRKMPTTELERLEGLMNELEKCRKNCEEKYELICEEYYDSFSVEVLEIEKYINSNMRRFIKNLDIEAWNFNCYNENFDLRSDFILVEEDFNVIADEINKKYVSYYKESNNMKLDILLEIARTEARKEQNIEVIQELETITPSDFVSDNGDNFKRIMRKITSPIGAVLVERVEEIIKAGTAGITSVILNHMGL